MNDSIRVFELPVEVQLPWQVMTCRAMRETYDDLNHPCRLFNRCYGPYPAYDWLTDQPEELLAVGEERSLQVQCAGMRFQVPELAGGCHKAPIMTIGINPNLTAYFPGPTGAMWCYPYFDDIAQYAAYFRHRSFYQERFTPDFIKSCVVPGSEWLAGEAGRATDAKVDPITGEITIKVTYNSGRTETKVLPKGTKVFVEVRRGSADSMVKGFAQGDLLAGTVAVKPGANTEVIQELVGYYQRFQAILDALMAQRLTNAQLRVGEDVLQGDMVACASPGWRDDYFSEQERNGIRDECVATRHWLALQYLQTSPAVVVISGDAAFDMFTKAFSVEVTPPIPHEGSVYARLKACARQRVNVTMQGGEITASSRLIVAPHFSYSDNYAVHYRFFPTEWTTFQQAWPEAAQKLLEAAKGDDRQGVRPENDVVFLLTNPAAKAEVIGEGAMKALVDQRLDPIFLIAGILVEEIDAGRLVIDQQSGHLVRGEGPCRFCDNQLFRIGKGCPYGKVKEYVTTDHNRALQMAAAAAVKALPPL